MKKYKVTYLTGWRGGFGEDSQTEIINAEDFEDAMLKANNKEWHPDAYAKIDNIEEVKDYSPDMYVDKDDVYSTAEEILTGNVMFVDQFGVGRFLDKYIDDICQDIRETADPSCGWCVDDVYLAIKRTIAKKLEIED